MSWPSSTIGFAQSDFHHVGDLCISELATSISNSDSSGDTFEVDSVTRFSTWPSTSFVVRVGTEDIFVSSRSGTTLTIGQREHGGTPKSSHGAGAKVRVVNSSVNIGSIHSEVRGVQDTLLGNTSDDLDISNIIDIDSSNNQVGINKSPSRALDVQGDGEVSGEMKANEFVGDGRRLTGIGDTGGLINDGNTTIAADDNSDGSGSIILQTQQTTRMDILSSGKVEVKDVDFSIDSTVFEVDATNDRVFLHGPASDPGSGSLSAGQIVFWLDEVNDQIEVRALESDGTTNITETISIIDPAGNDGELQYNNGGSFGATAGFTYDDTGQEVHFASATGIVLEESTANFTINWNDPGAARTLTVPDPGSNDVFLFEGRTLTGGTGIESIGDLSTDRTINFDTAAGLTITGDHDYSGGGVILPTATAPSPTTEGDIVWDTDDDKILVGDGSASVTMVKESRTLTGGHAIQSIGDLSADRTVAVDATDLSGDGLTDSGAGTALQVNPDTGIDVAASGVSVDQSFSPSWTGTHDYSGGDVVVPTKTSDPSSPSTGQIWLRTDL